MVAQAWDAERARALIGELEGLDGATLPVLHALQAEFGYVPDEAVPLVAEALNLSRAEVVGVLHFYHDFKHEPQGRHTLKVCRAEACQSMGCEALVEHIEGRLGVSIGETTVDGAVTFEAVYCLGNCALSPAMLYDGRLIGRVSPEKATLLIREARGG